MMTDKNDNRNRNLTIGAILIMVLFGFGYFLFNKDEGGITGIQALGQAGWNFWGWAIGLSAAAFGVFWAFGKIYSKVLDFGTTRRILIVGVLLLALAWGKGCDIKESQGVTSEKGRVGGPPPIDTTRMSAEDIIKQQQQK